VDCINQNGLLLINENAQLHLERYINEINVLIKMGGWGVYEKIPMNRGKRYQRLGAE